MAQAYVPTLQVTKKTTIQKRRELPLPGTALVKVGDTVKAETPVLRAELPGEIDIIRLADRLGFDPEDIGSGLKVKVGDLVGIGELIFEKKTFFGFLTSRLTSPYGGTVEFFNASLAHLGIRRQSTQIELESFVDGKIIEVEEGKSIVVETTGALMQGAFGFGGEHIGTICALQVANDSLVTPEILKAIKEPLESRILIGGMRYSSEALRFALQSGVTGIVCGSLHSSTVGEFLGRQLNVSITGDEDIPMAVMITEGFGELALSPRVTDIAKLFHGRKASISGITQVRAGAIRPELIVPHTDSIQEDSQFQAFLEVGARVRSVRFPFFGKFGKVTALPHEPQTIGSGATVRVVEIEFEESPGMRSMLPRANVELLS